MSLSDDMRALTLATIRNDPELFIRMFEAQDSRIQQLRLAAKKASKTRPQAVTERLRVLLAELHASGVKKEADAVRLLRKLWKLEFSQPPSDDSKKKKKDIIPKGVLEALEGQWRERQAQQLGCSRDELPAVREKGEATRLGDSVWKQIIREEYPRGLNDWRRVREEVYRFARLRPVKLPLKPRNGRKPQQKTKS